MSIVKRGTAALQHVKGSLQENFQRIPTFQKGPPLAPETREDSPNTVNPGLARAESDTGGRANSCGSAVTCTLLPPIGINPVSPGKGLWFLLLCTGGAIFSATNLMGNLKAYKTHRYLYWDETVVLNLGTGNP